MLRVVCVLFALYFVACCVSLIACCVFCVAFVVYNILRVVCGVVCFCLRGGWFMLRVFYVAGVVRALVVVCIFYSVLCVHVSVL